MQVDERAETILELSHLFSLAKQSGAEAISLFYVCHLFRPLFFRVLWLSLNENS